MKAGCAKLLLVFAILTILSRELVTCRTRSNRKNAEISSNSLESILKAALKSLNFFLENYQQLNLDAIIGIRILEGVLTQQMLLHQRQLPIHIFKKLLYVREVAEIAGDFGKDSVSISTPYYYSKMHFLMDGKLWNVTYPARHLPSEWPKITDSQKFGEISEEDSDNCLREFRKGNKCRVSKSCWDVFADLQRTSYELTHQVLYLLVGYGAQCGEKIEAIAGKETTAKRLDFFCKKILSEAQEIATNEYPPELRDLLMEQVGLCGISGYLEFANEDWRQKLLSWQAPNGCYHKFPEEKVNPANFYPDTYGNYRKRSEKIMSADSEYCLAHRTSVALMAMAVYIRRFVEDLSD